MDADLALTFLVTGQVSWLPVGRNRMAVLARYVLGSKAALLERAAEPRRTAMLTAVMRHLEANTRPGGWAPADAGRAGRRLPPAAR
ncbi:hypothetical protein [Streptomyces altiplanensis]